MLTLFLLVYQPKNVGVSGHPNMFECCYYPPVQNRHITVNNFDFAQKPLLDARFNCFTKICLDSNSISTPSSLKTFFQIFYTLTEGVRKLNKENKETVKHLLQLIYTSSSFPYVC